MRGTIPIFILLMAPTVAVAQANECLADLKMPAVGRWAEYKGLMRGKDSSTIRYAVIGSEQREGKDLKWLELRMTAKTPEKSSVFQLLTSGSPADMEQVEEVVTKFGTKAAMKLPPMMVQGLRGQVSQTSFLANLCEGLAPAGEESVTVPAGTFTALRYHSAKHESDTWVVPTLPFVVVKTKGKNFEMSLVSSGAGAKSSIVEKPQEMGFPSK